jgi:hypothetical protein
VEIPKTLREFPTSPCNPNVRIVRSAHLRGKDGETSGLKTGDFELKQVVCDLLDELMRLQDGTVVRLEFRHGLPFLLETTAAASLP